MANGSEALDSLFWRSEILQALFWMEGEGLASSVQPSYLANFLVADQSVVDRECIRLYAGGWLIRLADGSYCLSETGKKEGGRSFRDEFEGLTKMAHGECSPGCVCHDPAFAGQSCVSHSDH